MTVNQRIEKLINLLQMNPRSFSERVGVKESTIRNYVYRDSSPSADSLEKIFISIENLNAEWLLTGEGEPFKQNKELAGQHIGEPPQQIQVFRNGTEKHHELQHIPLYDVTASAGLLSLYNSTNNILDYLSIPNLPRCDGAIYLKGDSMYPLLKHGDMVVFQRLEDIPDDIDFGEMYVIDMSTPHRERIVVKYVHKSELGPDYIKLVSYNKNHEDKDVPLKKVRAMAQVKASIRLT